MTRFINRVCFTTFILLVVVGCATQPQPPVTESSGEVPGMVPPVEPPFNPEAPASEAPVEVAPLAKPPVARPNPAAESLAKQARALYFAQDYQGAIATAERGLRIDRQAPDLYLILAQSYVQLALPQKAVAFVQQGLRFAPQGSVVAESLLRVRQILDSQN